jgi:hypothetical protein
VTLRRLILFWPLVLVTLVSCEYRDSPTAPSRDVEPSLTFTGGFGTLLGTTDQGELVAIDLDAATVTLVGDAGIVEGDTLGWTDLASNSAGNLFTISRWRVESDGKAHVYTIDPSTGAVIQDIGSTGQTRVHDFDFLGDVIMGVLMPLAFQARPFQADATTAAIELIPDDTTQVVLGYNPFSPFPETGLRGGGFGIHPLTGELWAAESRRSNWPTLYRIDPVTGAADSIMLLGHDGLSLQAGGGGFWGIDGLHILDDGTFIGVRSAGFPQPIDSLLYEINPFPDPVTGLAEMALIPLVKDTLIQGFLTGLETAPGGGGPGPVTVTIETTFTTGADGESFISQAPENQVSQAGSVEPAALTPSLTWSVEVLTPRDALVVGPAGAGGETFDWLVPEQSTDRYDGYTHTEAIAAISSPAPHPNGLRFGVTLSATDGGGVQHDSQETVVAQDVTDIMRQEYVDYGRILTPARTPFGTFSTDHFSASELNFGDYDEFLATAAMRTGIEAVRAAVSDRLGTDTPLTLTSSYRNPVHHHRHAGATAPESQHQYGTAVDVRITDHGMTREEFFEYLRVSAQSAEVGVCWEPDEAIRGANPAGILTHAHLDWRSNCRADWRLN